VEYHEVVQLDHQWNTDRTRQWVTRASTPAHLLWLRSHFQSHDLHFPRGFGGWFGAWLVLVPLESLTENRPTPISEARRSIDRMDIETQDATMRPADAMDSEPETHDDTAMTAESKPDPDLEVDGEVEPRDGSGQTNGNDSLEQSRPSSASPALASAPMADRRNAEDAARAFLVRQTHAVIIPSFAAWFDMTTIHDIEKKSLPEFFNDRNRSKTPSVYKDYRDFMINTYRLSPSEYLTVTACRRNLAGDVCAIMRVHAFLEQWGIINYQIDPETRPSNIGPPFTGHFRVTADTPRGLQPFQPGVPTSMSAGKPHVDPYQASQEGAKVDLNIELRKDVYDTTGRPMQSLANGGESQDTEDKGVATKPQQQFNCFTCGIDCTRVRYHNVKTKKIGLCPNCYLEGRFPASSHSADFVKIENPAYSALSNESQWTDQETLLLLEGLELYEEDWSAIAEHVGTRTREQCVLRFLQLPIEDPYLETKQESLGPLQYSRVPFTQADNPVMSVVAFLASLIKPEIAAAAAGSSVAEITKRLRQGDSAQSGDTKNEDAMDMDQPNEQGLQPLERAASIALGSAAGRSHVLATNEEREISRLVTTAVNAQLKKMELKLVHFDQLEQVLEAEKRELEKARQQVFLERLSMKKQVKEVQEKLGRALNTGGQEGFRLAQEAETVMGNAEKLVYSPAEHGNEGQAETLRPLSVEKPEEFKSYQA